MAAIPIPTKRLNQNNLDLNPVMDKLTQWIGGEAIVNGTSVPRFGAISLQARRVPFFVYDDPSFAQRIGIDTAFTDGIHVFFYADFLRKLLQEDRSHRTQNTSFVGLHELLHILLMHHKRFLGYAKTKEDMDFVNQATDIFINVWLRSLFPKIKPGQELQIGCGMTDGDSEKYGELHEEAILRLLREKSKNQSKASQQSAGKKDKGGASGVPDKASASGANHLVSMEDLRAALHETGLDHVIEALNLPKTAQEAERRMEAQQQRTIADIAQAQYQANTNPEYPGKDITDYVMEIVTQISAPKSTWKTRVKEVLYGDGIKYGYSNAEAGDLYYYDPQDMGFDAGDEIYIGTQIPVKPDRAVVALVDTSGSVTRQMLSDFLGEIFGMARGNSLSAEVFVIPADTVIRGEPVLITESNAAEFADSFVLHGGGGTNFNATIHQLGDLPVLANKRLDHILYFTDLLDYPPQDPEIGLPITFVVPQNYRSPGFEKVVRDFAVVVEITEGETIDLDEIHENRMA